LNVSRLRHALNDESTRAATVLASWADAGFVQNNEMAENIRKKRFRWAKDDDDL
jgi:hypothetical protein